MATLTLSLPDEQYEYLKQQAHQNNRTIEEEAFNLLTKAIPQEEKLAPELEEKLAGLALLDDTALWQAAESHLSSRVIRKIEGLHFKREGKGLTKSEQEQLASLVTKYDEIILLRAEATRLLMERGKDVSKLIKKKA
jgi:plasmid stability protein